MGKNADRANTEFRRRAQDANGDFTAVGDEFYRILYLTR